MKEKHVYTRGGFVDLDTRSGNAARDFPKEDRSAVEGIEAYLAHVAGARSGKILCPFTKAIFERNGFRLKLVTGMPNAAGIETEVRSLGEELEKISPGRVGKGIPVDLKAVIAAFAHPECRTEEFAEKMREVHTRVRKSFLERGQMVSAMYETHPDVTGNRGFNSAVPLFVARRMSERDSVFLRTPDAEAIFRSFFPDIETN